MNNSKINTTLLACHSIIREERDQSKKLLVRSVIRKNMDWRTALDAIEKIYEREETSPKYIEKRFDYINGIAFLDNGITQIRYYILFEI